MISELSRKDNIRLTLLDLMANFLYYDRKEDPELGRGEIEEAIKNGEITIDEMVEIFRRELEESCR